MAERFRQFAFFVTPLMKLADRLRLCALHSRKMRNVSGFLHRHAENCRQSQAVCIFGALQPRKLRNVSGYLHCLPPPMMKLADSLRLCALQSRKLRNVSGILQRHDENGRQSQAVCIFGALQPRKLGDVSGYLHCFMKLADSLRLFAFLGRSPPENWGTSQAICIC